MDDLIMLPGPTPVIPEGLEAQSEQITGHRVKVFSDLLTRVTDNLKNVFMTDNN